MFVDVFTMGNEATFLDWNRDNIFINLIQAEDHLRNLDDRVAPRGEFLSCVSKHLAYVQGESLEAVSHCLVTEGKGCGENYQKIADASRQLRKQIQSDKIDPYDAILEVRRIRQMFEQLNPGFDTSKCLSCGSFSEEDVARLESVANHTPDIPVLEEKMLGEALSTLAKRENVPVPRLVLDPTCNNPNKGSYVDKTITMCKGSGSLHVITHEFSHYLDDLHGKPVDEEKAEHYADAVTRKSLNAYSSNDNVRSFRMAFASKAAVKETTTIYGSQLATVGVAQLNNYLDGNYAGAVMGQDPSIAVDSGIAIVGAVGSLKLKAPWNMVSGIIGGYCLADLANRLIQKYVAPATARVATVANTVNLMGRAGSTPNGTIRSVPAAPAISKFQLVSN